MLRLFAVIVVYICFMACLTTNSTTMAATAAKPGTLTVKVTAGGTALQGATVTVGSFSQTTNSAGTVTFALSLRQTYVVNVSAQWYVPWSTSVWLQKSQTVTVALQSAVVIPHAVLIIADTPVVK